MKSSFLMDFTVDRESRKINVKREFAAPVASVWAAWTEPELLDQWWAPKPWKAQTKTMDFRVGGYWLYAMLGPQGEEHWSRVDYQTITSLKSFKSKDAFCDSEGTINDAFSHSLWKVTFQDYAGNTLVTVELRFEKLEDLEKIIEMGFKEGFTSAHKNLDAILARE